MNLKQVIVLPFMITCVSGIIVLPIYKEISRMDQHIILLSDVPNGNTECCGIDVSANNYLLNIKASVINNCVSNYKSVLSCKSKNDFKQTLQLSRCQKNEHEKENGCVFTIYDTEDLTAGKIRCDQTEECIFYLNADNSTWISCRSGEQRPISNVNVHKLLKAKATSDGIFYNSELGAKFVLKETSACIRYNNIRFISGNITDNLLTIKLHSENINNCKLLLHDNIHHFVCQSKCEKSFKINDLKKDSVKVRIHLSCGNWIKDFWLFRTKSSEKIPFELYSRTKWTTVSTSFFALFIYTLIFGYPTVRIALGLIYVCVRWARFVMSYVYKQYMQFFMVDSDDDTMACLYCKNNFENFSDFDLHQTRCTKNVCPYCLINVDILTKKLHVKNCPQKAKSILKHERTLLEQYKSEIKVNKKSFREIWRNEWSKEKIPTFVWIVLVICTFILLFISPSHALDMPCNRVMGETVSCNGEITDDTQEGHRFWSRIELGYLNKNADRFEGNMHQKNAVNRLKNEVSMFNKGSSEKSLEFTVHHCNTDNTVCKATSIVSWSGSVKDGNVQAYALKDSNHHETSMHFVITGVELGIAANLKYYTTAWDIETKNGFDCTESDCSKVCTEDKENCVFKTFKRSKDTSWAHNPSWCFSINTGCTCVNVALKRKTKVPFYAVYETGDVYMKAVLCIEQNSKYIDCEIIDNVGTYNIHNNKVEVKNWMSKDTHLKYFIVPVHEGGNVMHSEIYINKVCDKNSCKMGSLGDIQFSSPQFNCSDKSFYFDNLDGIKGDLVYSFAQTPKWNIYHPKSGLDNNELINIKNYMKYHDAFFNFSSNMLQVLHGDIGSFSMEFELNDIDLYPIHETFKVMEFKTIDCIGEYGSERGGICTYKICIEGEYGTIKFTSDDNAFLQSDSQALSKGCNIIRKHMYVRSLMHNFKSCIIDSKQNRYCDNQKFNFSKPHLGISFNPGFTFTENNNEIDHECKSWFEIDCLWTKMKDFCKMLWKDILYISISALIVMMLIFTVSIIRTKRGNDNKLIIDYEKSDIVKKMMKMKEMGLNIEKFKNI